MSVSRYRRAHRHTLPPSESVFIPGTLYLPCQLSVKDCTPSGVDRFDPGGIFYHICDRRLDDLGMGLLMMVQGFLTV